MKKLAAIPMLLLAIIALLFPVASIAFSMDGYSLLLTYPNVTMAALTVVTLFLSLMAVAAKPGWFATLLAFLLPAFTALNCMFFMCEFPSRLTAILAVVCMLSVTVASLSCRRRVISFILILVFALLPLAGVGYIAYQHIRYPEVMAPAECETILELASPEGNYTAVVSRADYDGPFNTNITLYFNEVPVDFIVGRLQREPLLVHVMGWEDFDLADLKWIDETTLLCDGNTYSVTADSVTLVESAEEAEEAAIAEASAENVAAEEVVVEVTEAPVEEVAAVEPIEAATEAPVVEITVEATEEPVVETVEATEAPVEKITVEPTEEPVVETELAGAVVTVDGE